jgi:hypothetical protein
MKKRLYNRCPTPKQPEWHARDNARFANSAPFVDRDVIFLLPDSATDMTVEWEGEGEDRTAGL